LPRRGDTRSATIAVPVARMGVGLTTLAVAAPGSADTVRTRILVSLGDDLPIASFNEMLGYLRYFTTPERLRALREAPPAQRAEAWAQFLKSTDPIPGTPEHEGLRDYFMRIRNANQRFRDDGTVGWLSDRGVAFVGLGDPDNIYDSGMSDPSARVRQQVWEYREWRLQLVFLDQSGFGRWRLSPSGMAELQNAIRRRLSALP
jgi:GWxTD domain-containing protein